MEHENKITTKGFDNVHIYEVFFLSCRSLLTAYGEQESGQRDLDDKILRVRPLWYGLSPSCILSTHLTCWGLLREFSRQEMTSGCCQLCICHIRNKKTAYFLLVCKGKCSVS